MHMIPVLIIQADPAKQKRIYDAINWSKLDFFPVINAVTLEKARLLYLLYQPCLIITDIMLPDGNGMELIKQIRLHDRHTQFIILTESKRFEDALSAIEYQVFRYLDVNTFEASAFTSVLNQVFNIMTDHSPEINNYDRTHVNPSKATREPPVQAILEYISKHYAEDLTLSKVAKMFYFSPNYIGTIFRKQCGMSYTEYVSSYRITRSYELLVDKTLSINEIAHMVGFNDARYFIRVFKKHTGSAPNQYRRKLPQ